MVQVKFTIFGYKDSINIKEQNNYYLNNLRNILMSRLNKSLSSGRKEHF